MDIERLSKHQIVLLTLLVSFMTSMATGIVTVSLMDQAPPGVTKTINQIIEHTVQTVTPATQGAAVTTVKTVVVKDDDLAAQSIGTVQKGIVRIVGKGDDKLVARGVIIDNKGTVLTDKGALFTSDFGSFEAILYDGNRVALSVPKGQSTSSQIALVKASLGTSTAYSVVPIVAAGNLKLGQSVIRIGGAGSDIVGEGIIASLPVKGSSEVQASVSSSMPGSIIMTMFGEVAGITTTDSLNSGSGFYTIASIPVLQASAAAKITSGS